METIDWVREPNLAPDGLRDSQVFVSAVTAIFERSRTTHLVKGRKHPSQLIDAEVRDLLTYLLLRRQPSTADHIPLDYPGKECDDLPERIDLMMSATQRKIEEVLNGKSANAYPVMLMIEEANLDRSAVWVKGEELTLWILALGIFSSPLSPKDFYTVHRCLNLYYRSEATAKQVSEKEFAEDPMRLVSWISTELERICLFNDTTKQIFHDAAYVGLFASLVRASRMTEDNHPIRSLLRDEVMQLQEIRQHTGRVVKCSQ